MRLGNRGLFQGPHQVGFARSRLLLQLLDSLLRALFRTQLLSLERSNSQDSQDQLANLQALMLRPDDVGRAAITALPKKLRCVNPPFAPKWDTVGVRDQGAA